MGSDRIEDEQLLIDFVLGRCGPRVDREVRDRLESDESLRRLHDDLAHTVAALDLRGELDPPEGLVEKTMGRIRLDQQTTALLLAEAERGPRGFRPVFSLRELGALVAATVLLALVFVPSIRRARYRALIGRCRANAGQIGVGLRTYANANGGWLPAASGVSRRWLVGGNQPAVSNSAGLFRLVRCGYVSPRPFRCPGSPSGAEGGFDVTPERKDFPNGGTISYSYQHTVGAEGFPRPRTVLVRATSSMAILADETPVFRNGRFLRDRVGAAAGDNHDATGQSVLYLDMHVEFQPGADVGVDGNNIFLADGIYDYQGDERPVHATDTFLLPAFSGN